MDPIKLEKFQAMKRNRKRRQLLQSTIQHLLAGLLLVSFLSSPLWISYLSSFFKSFFIFLPNLVAAVFGAKCLFLAGNLIVVFLIIESKFSWRCSKSDIYEEYMKKQRNLQLQCEKDHKGSSLKKAVNEEEGWRDGGELDLVLGYEDMDGEEEDLTELTKRSEDLIARVNKQWRLEATMLCSCDRGAKRVQKLEKWIETKQL